MMFKYYLKIWLMMCKNSLLNWSVNRGVLLVFLTGKIIRYVFSFGFLYFLVKGTNGLLNYSGNEILFFVSTFILLDTLAQFFFRNVYSFRPMVMSGDFDLVLVKPVNALFRVLLGGPDPIDLVTIPPILFVVVWVGASLHPGVLHIAYYILLITNGLIIAAAFHIAVLAFGIITLEVDHMIMVYRDVSSVGRFPIDIYKQPIQGLLTFVIPIGVMFTIPAKVLMGRIELPIVLLSLAFGVCILLAALKFWNFALKKYASASS